MTVSQYDHVVPYTDLGGRGYFGVNAALVNSASKVTLNNMEKSQYQIIAGHYKSSSMCTLPTIYCTP